jgi:hypothetical protein
MTEQRAPPSGDEALLFESHSKSIKVTPELDQVPYPWSMRSSLGPLLGCALLLGGCGGPAEKSPTKPSGSGGNSGGTSSAGGSAGTSGGSAGQNGGSAATTGGATSGGSGGEGAGPSGGSGGSNPGVSAKCETPVGPGLPDGAPTLEAGTWVNISPAEWPFDTDPFFTQGIAVDPCNPAILYLTTSAFDTTNAGLFKSLDAGASWTKVGNLDEPIRVRINPENTQHLYVGDGVRGGTMGFWVSTDGGDTWTQPEGFSNLQSTENLYPFDVYDVAVDPTDFNHVLVAFHGAWGWTDSEWNTNSGVIESTDGGESWIVHAPMDGWGTGHAITFLYNPELGLGDANTWLLGTQGNGMFRTTDAGTTWDKVSDNGIQHGGGTVYYTAAGHLYASGVNSNMKSTDNGATWKAVGPGGGYNGIGGDGVNLYAAKCFGPTPFITSPESDGETWTDFNSQQFDQGSFEFAFDHVNGILYSGSWGDGIWALKTE